MSSRARRLEDNVRRGRAVRLLVDGEPLVAFEGETVAAALLAAGRRVFGHTSGGEPRGVFCGMGICTECTVTLEGQGNVYACTTPVREGMRIVTAAAVARAGERS